MSVKSQFLQKLQFRQPALALSVSKCQADIAEFRLRMTQLQEQMDTWLEGTGLNLEALNTSVMDLLVEGGAFDIAALILRIDDRSVKFVPTFLYDQSVNGCVDVTLHADGSVTSVGRLFMRTGQLNEWRLTHPGAPVLPGEHFDEDAFFGLILSLLP
ncbi:hypothetical protein Q9R34_14735 [Enterobacter sp. BRE11]|nr:hypothetical protein [Enterobacter sp. BRE11]